MRKVVLFTAGFLVIASTSLAEKIPMWRFLYESKDASFHMEDGSFRFFENGWSFKIKTIYKNETIYTTTTRFCMESENGLWVRETNGYGCKDGSCTDMKDTDWIELDRTRIGYITCVKALPFCKKDQSYSFCRNK